jgi:hypothetical protein
MPVSLRAPKIRLMYNSSATTAILRLRRTCVSENGYPCMAQRQSRRLACTHANTHTIANTGASIHHHAHRWKSRQDLICSSHEFPHRQSDAGPRYSYQ